MKSGTCISLRYSAWVLINADGSLKIYIYKNKVNTYLSPYYIVPSFVSYFELVSVLARMRACTCTISYEPSLRDCIRNFGKFIKNTILFLSVSLYYM